MFRKLVFMIVILVLVVFASGCAGAEPLITLSFDGKDCVHDGPGSLKTEEVTLIFETEEIEGRNMMHQFVRLSDGATWDDFIATFPNDGAGGELQAGITGPPPFLKSVISTTGENEGEYIYSIKPGETYVTFCIIQSPVEVYPGGMLSVE